jgi:DNA invertase Pin-like site-specific DNA recombinase
MKVVGYARVSTKGQAEDGLGLPVQVAGIEKWAKAHGHELVAVVTDEGISGTRDAWERPGLTEVLGLLESGSVEGLVVHRLDRLARSLTVQEGVLAHVWKHGAHVFSVDTGPVLQDDPDDPMRTAMRQMAGVFAQLERAMLVKRLRDGRKHKAALGGHPGGGSPFGFRPGGWSLEEDPTEQETLALIKRLHAEGHNASDIARSLNDRGLLSKRGGRWHPTSVRRIVGRMLSEAQTGDLRRAG